MAAKKGKKQDKEGRERRQHPRVPMMVKLMDGGEEKQCFSREIGIGGLFLETDEKYTMGQVLNLQFQIPGTNREINATGKVVHIAEGKEKPHGVGIQFENIDGNSENIIRQYVEKLENIRKKLSSES